MMKMLLGVGSKVIPHAIIALVVGLILFYVIQSTETTTEQRIEKQILETQIEKRKKIDDAVRKAPPNNSGDASDSLQYLRNRKP